MIQVSLGADAKRFREAGYWRDTLVTADFAEAVAKAPDKTAIIEHRATDGATTSLSFADLSTRVDRIAGGLVDLGVERGDVISVQLPNWWQFNALMLAAVKVGAVINPIMPILRQRELRFILDRVDAKMYIAPDTFKGFDHAATIMSLKPDLPNLEHVVAVGPETPPGAIDFDAHFMGTAWEELHPPATLAHRAAQPDDVAQIMFTSGTTGEPKGVLHTHNTLDASMRAVPLMCEIQNDDVVIMPSPTAHQAGYMYGMAMPAVMGLTVVLQDTWDAAVMTQLATDHGATWTFCATPFAADAIAHVRKTGKPAATFQNFICAGAPVPPSLIAEAREVLGVCLGAAWGMTEVGCVTVTDVHQPDDAATSDGRSVHWMELKVVGPGGDELPRGEEGRLVSRGPSQFLGYLKRQDLYDSSMTADGFFDSGDLARMDDTGAIRITGRTKDLIIRGGENVPAVEVEACLYRHPDIDEVSVVGLPDDRLGERAAAVIVTENKELTLGDLQTFLKGEGMARSFWPESITLVDEMPRTPSGKIQKFALRDKLLAGNVKH